MTDECPTVGYTCVDTMRAKVQAVTDQLEGFVAFLEGTNMSVPSNVILKHYAKCAALLQEALDDYTEDHGRYGPTTDLHAVQWVLESLKK
jgi:hypothetical protein